MQTPKRKPGKYAGKKPDPKITLEKYLELKEKLERLVKYSRPPAIKEVKRLASDGDFSENAAYQIAKGRLRGINQRITDIEDWLKRAEIIKPSDADIIEVGHRVTVGVGGKEKTYTILGSSETNPDLNIVSHASPIGSALLGRKIDEVIEVVINEKVKKYKIIKIK